MKHKGFTLIELLVVIAIIGLLASVVLLSLNASRTKAKDTAIRQNMLELRKIAELDYSETGDYDNLQQGRWTPADIATCNATPWAGNYATKAKEICNSIIALVPSGGSYQFFSGYANMPGDPVNGGGNKSYSFMAQLSSGSYYCVGSSGISNDVTYNGPPYAVGCYYNP